MANAKKRFGLALQTRLAEMIDWRPGPIRSESRLVPVAVAPPVPPSDIVRAGTDGHGVGSA